MYFPYEMTTLYFVLAGRDELFGKFVDALDRLHFFRSMPDGNDDQSQLDAATDVFRYAVKVT